MIFSKTHLAVYFVLDPACCAGRDVATVADAAVRGGVSMIQYRDKLGDEAAVRAGALAVQEVIAGRVPFVVNDYVEIAAEIGADGAHIGQGDMSPAAARHLLGADKILGLTAFTPEHMAAVDSSVVDYVGTGPFFPTLTDKGKPVLGAEGFAAVAKLSPVPVVGIGGITADNAAQVIAAGADGVAMMRAISAANDVEAAARVFREVFDGS